MLRKLVLFLLIVVLLLPLPINPLSLHSDKDKGIPQNPSPSITEEDVAVVTFPAEEDVPAAQSTDTTQKYSEIPILMYHVLEDFSGTYEELYVSPQNFRRQLAYLKEQGYHTVKLEDVLEHWKNGQDLPKKPIVLSFDDGYRSMYTVAFPFLTEFEYLGTFFLHTDNLDTPSGLTKEMVQEMVAGGMEIGSHTVSHPDLTKTSTARLQKELRDSKKILSQLTGSTVQTLAYPAGRYNEKVIAEVEAAGYSGAVTTASGSSSVKQDSFSLKRLRINKSDGLKGFIKKIQAHEAK